jgi:hypothetical protein
MTKWNFLDSNSIDLQLNVIAGSEYDNYKNGVFPNSENRDLNPNNEYTTTFYERQQGVKNDASITYKINSSGQRCDEFKKNHEGKHILFSGCSFTFGESLPYKKNWAGYLYDKLNKAHNLSGYYTVAYPGGGVDVITNNIYKYCDIYGNPDAIFLLIPEASRKILWGNDKYYSIISPYERYPYDVNQGFENAVYSTYHYMHNLEIFCNKLNIKLMWSSWHQEEARLYNNMNFKNYIHIEHDEIIKKANNYKEINSPYYGSARDNCHPGLMFSDGVSSIFLEKINENNIL